MKMTLEDAHH